jgi:uncharacterized membrane protein
MARHGTLTLERGAMAPCSVKALLTSALGMLGVTATMTSDATEIVQLVSAVGICIGIYIGLYWSWQTRKKQK